MTNTFHTLAKQMSQAFWGGTRATTGALFRKPKDSSPENG